MGITISIPIKETIIFGVDELNKHTTKFLPPNNVGTYVLRDKHNNALYVGMSTNLNNRLRSHLRGSGDSEHFFSEIKNVEVNLLENNSYADILETHLIMSENPKYNKAKVPQESNDLTSLETALFDLDEKIAMWEEQVEEILSEIDGGYHELMDESSCMYSDIKHLREKIDDAKKKRDNLMRKGAKPLENFSLLAHIESQKRASKFYRRAILGDR